MVRVLNFLTPVREIACGKENPDSRVLTPQGCSSVLYKASAASTKAAANPVKQRWMSWWRHPPLTRA